jgi:FlaA1/EpsC-like NDP-sugar epimerase
MHTDAICSRARMAETPNPKIDRVVVFSRDELKQHQMREDGFTDSRLRWFLGDVRDRDRLRWAMQGVDVVVHAAALKQVDALEYNPGEAVKTNITGTDNVIHAAIDSGVRKVLFLSTDKAVDPINTYGKSKAAAEALVIAANSYSGKDGPLFSAVRYGNVLSSRGSVLPKFRAQHAAGKILTVTDPRMTRFVLTIDQGVLFVQDCLDAMQGGEVFVPKLDAVMVDIIAQSVTGTIMDRFTPHTWKSSGLRPGEKMHELLVSEHEAYRTIDAGWCYIIQPVHDFGRTWEGSPVPDGFRYSSDSVPRLDVDAFRTLAGLT